MLKLFGRRTVNFNAFFFKLLEIAFSLRRGSAPTFSFEVRSSLVKSGTISIGQSVVQLLVNDERPTLKVRVDGNLSLHYVLEVHVVVFSTGTEDALNHASLSRSKELGEWKWRGLKTKGVSKRFPLLRARHTNLQVLLLGIKRIGDIFGQSDTAKVNRPIGKDLNILFLENLFAESCELCSLAVVLLRCLPVLDKVRLNEGGQTFVDLPAHGTTLHLDRAERDKLLHCRVVAENAVRINLDINAAVGALLHVVNELMNRDINR